MKEQTKKDFNAPWQKSFQDWESYKEITIYDSKKQPVCLTRNKEMSNRLASLPEMYEELKSASYDFCWACLATLGKNPPTADELIENLCPRKPTCCGYNNRWKLLRKVRDGK